MKNRGFSKLVFYDTISLFPKGIHTNNNQSPIMRSTKNTNKIMKNEKLFKRANNITRFNSTVIGREGDYGLGKDKWTDAFVLDEMLYVLEVFEDGSNDYQYTLEYGTAAEKKEMRSKIAEIKRIIAAYQKLGVKPESMSDHYGF
jgi:hypothetical protein